MDDDLTRHTDDDALLKDPRIEALEAARESNGQAEPPVQRVERVETVQTVRPVPVHDDPHIYEEPYSIPAGDTYYEPAPVRGQAPRAGLEGWIIAIVFGLIYGISAIVFGALFLWGTIDLGRNPTAGRAMRVFGYSITYVTLLFGAMTIDVLVRHPG